MSVSAGFGASSSPIANVAAWQSGVALVAMTLFGGVTAANAVPYTLTDLGPGIAFGINDAGQVVGVSGGIATIWNGTTPTALDALPGGTGSGAHAINNAGQVVGASIDSSGNLQAVIWNDSATPTALSTLAGGTSSYATAINSSGQVAGVTNTATINNTIATVWNGTTPTALVALLGSSPGVNEAHGINNAGQVVGISGVTATIWNGTTPTALGTPAGGTGDGLAFAINNSGRAAGLSYAPGGVAIATLWSGTTPTALASLSTELNAFATSINEAGVAVGYATSPTSLAVIWNATIPIALNTLLDASDAGWLIQDVYSINNSGQIVGRGAFNGVGSEALLLTPCRTCNTAVPAPATLPLFATGLGLVGWFGWRRRRQQLA